MTEPTPTLTFLYIGPALVHIDADFLTELIQSRQSRQVNMPVAEFPTRIRTDLTRGPGGLHRRHRQLMFKAVRSSRIASATEARAF